MSQDNKKWAPGELNIDPFGKISDGEFLVARMTDPVDDLSDSRSGKDVMALGYKLAAAPRLYNALEGSIERLEFALKELSGLMDEKDGDLLLEQITEARAALAAARGRGRNGRSD